VLGIQYARVSTENSWGGNWTLRLRDISPTRHFAYDMDISPTRHFTANQTTITGVTLGLEMAEI